jgi:hypothetical protein
MASKLFGKTSTFFAAANVIAASYMFDKSPGAADCPLKVICENHFIVLIYSNFPP